MTGSCAALIVATDRYDDKTLHALRAPAEDAPALAATLADPAIGGFSVRTLINKPTHVLAEEIEAFFADRVRDDLLLLYFSCHGIKDDDGRLYFASTNTKMKRLAATGLSSAFVNEQMNRTRSRKVVLLLDCCYSGAFGRGMVPRSAGQVDVHERFEGRGRAVITASSAMEYAFEMESESISGTGTPSVFTAAVLRGLQTGEADLDGDGRISVDELYDYVFRYVQKTTPNQTPSIISDVQGELFIARTASGVPAVRGPDTPVPQGVADVGRRTAQPRNHPRRLKRRTAVLSGGAIAAAAAAVLVAVLVTQQSTGPKPTGQTAVESPTASPRGTPPASAVHTNAPARTGVLSQGTTRLGTIGTGLDLTAGRVVGLTESHLSWDPLTGTVLVWDETTLGAVRLGMRRFDAVTPAQLASAAYARGDGNPPLTPRDLPLGSVLAVRVAPDEFAKVSVLGYHGNTIDVRWLTYSLPGAGSGR